MVFTPKNATFDCYIQPAFIFLGETKTGQQLIASRFKACRVLLRHQAEVKSKPRKQAY